MRIGIFGGTFNPVHNGHLALAEEAISRLRLDKVVFVPAYIPVHKSRAGVISADDRVRMIELAAEAGTGFEISRYEIDRKKKTYSIETVRHFRQAYPKAEELFFLAGADSLSGIDSWKEADKLLKLCRFAVFSRPGFPKGDTGQGIEFVDMQGIGISSTQVRRLIRENKPFDDLVPKRVADYILRNNLYKTGGVDNA